MDSLRKIFPALAVACALGLAAHSAPAQELNLTPVPLNITTVSGSVPIPEIITYSAAMPTGDLADLKAYLPSYALKMSETDNNAFIRIRQGGFGMPDEAYRLEITEQGVDISADTPAGVFYALQTLAQLARNSSSLPIVNIDDAPRFPYRGMHLDVSRHFFDVDHIKRQLDMVATYKINRFHWHLTDATGWRLEIPSRPRLTEFAAWRPQATYAEWRDSGAKYCEQSDPNAHGGFYTAADVAEVIEYARLRHITVIPEIEMPGHSAEVTAAYPETSCYGEPYTSGEVCIGSEQTFEFFEDVLDELIRLFPSHYIHIGGDEASRRHWKQCPKCQKRIADNGLNGEDGLQSYMIERIEKFVNSRGRDIIGWDEILDGGLAPNATVMSWRGIEGGIKAATLGHDAIMTPEAYCYLDHYQDDPETQPLAFGSPVTIFQSYSFDPAPDSLAPEIRKHIIGVQGNTWAEYIPTPEHAEYMLYPRMIALAEVGWSQTDRKDPESFKHRVNNEIRHMKSRGYNPFTLSQQVQTAETIDYDNKYITLSLSSEKDPIEIRYTTDGSEPERSSQLYTAPFTVRDSLKITARLFENGLPIGQSKTIRTDFHKAIGKQVRYTSDGGYYTANEIYKAGGDSALVDGLRGGKSYLDARWQGFCPNDLDVTIDLGELTDITRVMANFMQIKTPQVFLPEKVEIWTSTDGNDFRLLHTDLCPADDAAKDVAFRNFGWTGAPRKARYVRYHAIQGEKQFLFTDEIVIQ